MSTSHDEKKSVYIMIQREERKKGERQNKNKKYNNKEKFVCVCTHACVKYKVWKLK